MKELIELAKDIESDSKKREDFSKLCHQKLSSFSFDKDLTTFNKELAEWISSNEIPKQVNIYNTFGQPPVTLFNNGEFVLDLYIWMHEDTSIHSHSFSGAFKVLYGKSRHDVYEVAPIKKFSDDIHHSVLKQIKNEEVFPGDTNEIIAGDSFTHALIHLEAPTVTLCVRTVNDMKRAQWHHFPNGLSVQKRALDEKQIKSVFYYQYLLSQDETLGYDFMKNSMKNWDLSVALNFYEQLSIDGMGLEEHAIDPIANIFLELHGETEWFKLYTNFYESMS